MPMHPSPQRLGAVCHMDTQGHRDLSQGSHILMLNLHHVDLWKLHAMCFALVSQEFWVVQVSDCPVFSTKDCGS